MQAKDSRISRTWINPYDGSKSYKTKGLPEAENKNGKDS
jgi:hypothetical protein